MYYGAKASIFEKARELRANMTEAEKKMWTALSNKKMKGFRFKSQHPIRYYIVDFYCHQVKLVIEIDGTIHADPAQADYDKGRTYDLESLGITVIRFSNEQVFYHLKEILLIIEKHLTMILREQRPTAIILSECP